MNERAEKDVFLSIVIPAYNEAARIGASLAKIAEFLPGKEFAAEVIVVDDGSRDGTAAVADEALRDWPRAKVIARTGNRGKGYSVREGVLASSGRVILMSDADLSTPIGELDFFLSLLEQGCDVVIGSRALPASDIQVRQSAVRETMGKAFNLLVRLLVLPGIRDTQCGFKLFRREAALECFSRLRTRRFAFDVEALALCRKLGYRICEAPVVWRNSPPSRVRLIGSSAGMLRDLVRIRFCARRSRSERTCGKSAERT